MKLESNVSLYERDVFMVYDYGLRKKLVRCNFLRKSGFELETKRAERGTANTEKEDSNLVRARARVQELALCNDWDFFVTLTLNPKQFDRMDLKAYKNALTQWLRNYGKKYHIKVDYVLIPEMHKDGAWHMHGFLKGLPIDHLRLFTIEETLPYYILNKISKGCEIYNWEAYQEKFGFIDIERIRSQERASSYISKYITKDSSRLVTELNANLYYCSQGLKRKVRTKKGTFNGEVEVPWDYKNDYVSIKWFDADVPIEDYITATDYKELDMTKAIKSQENNIKKMEERQLYKFTNLDDDNLCPFTS